jgi:hypothetical protein
MRQLTAREPIQKWVEWGTAATEKCVKIQAKLPHAVQIDVAKRR